MFSQQEVIFHWINGRYHSSSIRAWCFCHAIAVNSEPPLILFPSVVRFHSAMVVSLSFSFFHFVSLSRARSLARSFILNVFLCVCLHFHIEPTFLQCETVFFVWCISLHIETLLVSSVQLDLVAASRALFFHRLACDIHSLRMNRNNDPMASGYETNDTEQKKREEANAYREIDVEMGSRFTSQNTQHWIPWWSCSELGQTIVLHLQAVNMWNGE